MTTGTAVATIKGKVYSLEQLLTSSHEQIAKALPYQIPVDRLARVAITTVRKNPQLQACNALSIVACVIQGAQLGLELDGVLGNAYMVPYKDRTGVAEANFQIGYKGLMNLAYRSSRVSRIDAKAVCEGDKFDYEYGTSPFITHKPLNASTDKTHYYCIVHLADGFCIFQVMTKEEVDAHRDKYSRAAQSDKKSPWDTSYDAMALKTVIRQTLKTAPLTVDLQTAISLDEQAEAGIPQQLAKTLSDSITGTEDETPGEDFNPDIEHNRDEYPAIGQHSEKARGPKAAPCIWREVPDDYIKWAIDKAKDTDFRNHALAEKIARDKEKKASTETTAEYEDVPQSKLRDELLEILEHPALSQEFTDDMKALVGQYKGEDIDSWYQHQIDLVKGTIADAEKKQEGQGELL